MIKVCVDEVQYCADFLSEDKRTCRRCERGRFPEDSNRTCAECPLGFEVSNT
jgi:hypothetical protein